ncbi:hypothetical protein DXG03_003217 [Asterophora parasitica]|uniref:Xylanolytic transcriptional activator regulatory domain-containing protein n=1 Tax=Asterophora parasitica TaxID=117018 RepID=A0A9P7GEQ9_9AGAR|nr:hypothetical protein DXG03_003217 [Asterophora parasitica]
MPDNRCSNCIEYNSECTHNGPRKRSHPYPTQASIHTPTVHSSQGPSQTQFAQSTSSEQGDIHPRIQSILSTSPLTVDLQNSLLALSRYIVRLEQDIVKAQLNLSQAQLQGTTSASPSNASQTSFSETHEDSQSEDDSVLSQIEEADLSSQVKRLTICSTNTTRHFGASSSFSLLGAALKVGKDQVRNVYAEHKYSRRPQFWSIPKWEAYPEEIIKTYEFPDPDLLKELVVLYFEYVNSHFPLFHRLTYEKLIDDKVHLTDRHFAATVLGVCAVAARYSDDPRVLLDSATSWHSAGWKWYQQTRPCWLSSSRTPSLYEIQSLCLSILYAGGTSQPEACWVMVGLGVRFAQDVGAHRKKANETSTVEAELWKRCFWVLVSMDTVVCSFVGRPRATVYDE